MLDTVTAVKNRILQLCGERNITINKLANISALPPSSVKAIRNRPITPRHIAKKKRSETDLSNSNKFSIWQHRNIRTK